MMLRVILWISFPRKPCQRAAMYDFLRGMSCSQTVIAACQRAMLRAELIERAAHYRSAGDDPSRQLYPPFARLPRAGAECGFHPLSYYPLSLWPWQTAIKAVFLERVDIIASYEREVLAKLGDAAAIGDCAAPICAAQRFPAFTRFNVFLRDKFACQYCGSPHQLTFDHVLPRRLGGRTSWEKHCGGLFALQPEEGRAHPARGGDAAAHPADPPHKLAIAGTRPRLSARPPA
jgi:hypothetical protein